jgi:hypothetical protein
MVRLSVKIEWISENGRCQPKMPRTLSFDCFKILDIFSPGITCAVTVAVRRFGHGCLRGNGRLPLTHDVTYLFVLLFLFLLRILIPHSTIYNLHS